MKSELEKWADLAGRSNLLYLQRSNYEERLNALRIELSLYNLHAKIKDLIYKSKDKTP